ncbi:MAG: 1-acyl-sn-glycerol-3-phosphate acyltransferase [Spirochaetales bacterium]|nr:1-acyl-sn-glycerol-3-phosphate acyltransferase [Spirochaetales bacterium]
MAYHSGDHPINLSVAFRVLSHFVFYTVLYPVVFVSRVIFGLRLQGWWNLRRARPALLVSNHTLFLDPGVLAAVLFPFRTYFTMLEETALIPVLGTFVRLLGAVPIPINPRAFRLFESDVRRGLDDMGFVHFFPEGECFQWSQVVQSFHPGVFVLAARLGVPVIPVATVLHARTWGGRSFLTVLGRRVYIPPRVTVVIGRPIDPGPGPGWGRGSLRAAAEGLQERARTDIQAAIDRQGGSKTIYRGQMPRIAGDHARR